MSDLDAEEGRVMWHFVLTRADMHPEMQAIQLGHACAESVLPEHAPVPKNARMCWKQVADENELRAFAALFERKGVPHALVIETDGEHAGAATALGITTLQRSKISKLLHHLPRGVFLGAIR